MHRAFAAICILTLLAGCAGGEDGMPGRHTLLPDTGRDFPSVWLSIPEGVSMRERSVGRDARLYDFSLSGRTILGLYLGANPTFAPADGAREVESETVGGLPAKTVVARSGDRWSRDMLVTSRRPIFYHFYYRDLGGSDLIAADHIIGSLQER